MAAMLEPPATRVQIDSGCNEINIKKILEGDEIGIVEFDDDISNTITSNPNVLENHAIPIKGREDFVLYVSVKNGESGTVSRGCHVYPVVKGKMAPAEGDLLCTSTPPGISTSTSINAEDDDVKNAIKVAEAANGLPSYIIQKTGNPDVVIGFLAKKDANISWCETIRLNKIPAKTSSQIAMEAPMDECFTSVAGMCKCPPGTNRIKLEQPLSAPEPIPLCSSPIESVKELSTDGVGLSDLSNLLGSLPFLKVVNLAGAEIDDDGAKIIATLPNIEKAILPGNKITGKGFNTLAGCDDVTAAKFGMEECIPTPVNSLEELDVSGNVIEHGIYMPSSNLSRVNISGNKISGINAEELPALRILEARDNLLDDFPWILSMPNLNGLDLSGNRIISTRFLDIDPNSKHDAKGIEKLVKIAEGSTKMAEESRKSAERKLATPRQSWAVPAFSSISCDRVGKDVSKFEGGECANSPVSSYKCEIYERTETGLGVDPIEIPPVDVVAVSPNKRVCVDMGVAITMDEGTSLDDDRFNFIPMGNTTCSIFDLESGISKLSCVLPLGIATANVIARRGKRSRNIGRR